MKIKSIALAVKLIAAVVSTITAAASATEINASSAETSNAQMPVGSTVLFPSDTLTTTVYLPLISKPLPPLFVGMTARWDSAGYGRGSEVWDAGYHLTRNLDTMTDSDTIRSNNYAWYSPNPFNWPDESWYSYYSVSTLQFKASSAPPNPDWKWAGANWILPYNVALSNGATVMIDGQAFLVSGPYSGYTAFGQAVLYWQLTNRDKFLIWDNGGDWAEYIHPGEITLRYDAGSTRLLLYNNELRHWYYRGNLTSDTIQWIDNLTSTNAWPTSQSEQQGLDSAIRESTGKQTQTMWTQQKRGGLGKPAIP